MPHQLTEITRVDWPQLRDLYAAQRTSSTGFDLIENFIKWYDNSEEINIYALNDVWQNDGTFILIHTFHDKTEIYINTLSESLARLCKALEALAVSWRIDSFHLFCGYAARLRPAVAHYYRYSGRAPDTLIEHGCLWYHLAQQRVTTFDVVPPNGIALLKLRLSHAAQINDNWEHRAPDSIEFVKRLIAYNINVGAFDSDGSLIAWCLRNPQGSLGLLHVMDAYKRQGIGSLLVRYMARKINATGAEVLSTIIHENVVSRKLFEKLGFIETNQIYWAVIPCVVEK